MDRAVSTFARAIDDLKSRLGVVVADLLPEEIVALVRASERVANPFSSVNADAAGMPVMVSDGVFFWPLTIGSVVWLEETADRWWGDDPKKYRNALVYAAANARNQDAFASVDFDEVRSRIRTCLRKVTATSAEIDVALDRILSGSGGADGDTEGTAASWANLIAEIEAGTGVPREHWLWGVGYRETLRTYHEMRSLALASAGKKSVRMLDELDRAVNALQRLKVNIMKRVGNG